MPIHLCHINAKQDLDETPVNLSGEMEQADFNGPSRFDWYYGTFESSLYSFSVHNDEFNELKRQLAAWLSDPANMIDPYYVHEGHMSAHGGMGCKLSIIILNPHDILSFQKVWGQEFRFNPDNARKNLQEDVRRIGKGYKPQTERLSAVYARFTGYISNNTESPAEILTCSFLGPNAQHLKP